MHQVLYYTLIILLFFIDQIVQFTHYVIFAKADAIFIKKPMIYTKPLQAGLHATISSILCKINTLNVEVPNSPTVKMSFLHV